MHPNHSPALHHADTDAVDSSSNTRTKDQALERLNKRNKERQNYLDIKLEQRHKDHADAEGSEYFAQRFSEKVKEIEVRIKNISEAASKKPTGEAPSFDLARHFADITLEVQELQRFLTRSTMFLADFKIKACQSIINDLMQSCEETRIRLMPKKKFGFSGRKVTPKPSLNPRLAKTDASQDVGAKHEPDSANSKMSWTLCDKSNEYICLKDSEVSGNDITISNLRNCFVEIQGPAGSVQISHCSDCTFLCGPIARSLFAEFCSNCTLNVACQQMRLHSSTQCHVFLHVTCRAIIEDCKAIDVAPYSYDYPGIEDHFQAAQLNKEQNNYADIADFNWLSPDVPSPNWKLVKDSPTINWLERKQQFMTHCVDNSSL